MEITLIAALTRDRVIGSESGGIPWDMPRDKAHFRAYTAHKPILLGRQTFEEMRGWFTTQHPVIVLTHRPKSSPHTPATVSPSIAEAISLTRSQNHPELVVAGGASVFETALPHATKLVLTWIDFEFAPLRSPVHFPPFDSDEWPLSHSETWLHDESNPYPATLEFRHRRQSADLPICP